MGVSGSADCDCRRSDRRAIDGAVGWIIVARAAVIARRCNHQHATLNGRLNGGGHRIARVVACISAGASRVVHAPKRRRPECDNRDVDSILVSVIDGLNDGFVEGGGIGIVIHTRRSEDLVVGQVSLGRHSASGCRRTAGTRPGCNGGNCGTVSNVIAGRKVIRPAERLIRVHRDQVDIAAGDDHFIRRVGAIGGFAFGKPGRRGQRWIFENRMVRVDAGINDANQDAGSRFRFAAQARPRCRGVDQVESLSHFRLVLALRHYSRDSRNGPHGSGLIGGGVDEDSVQ